MPPRRWSACLSPLPESNRTLVRQLARNRAQGLRKLGAITTTTVGWSPYFQPMLAPLNFMFLRPPSPISRRRSLLPSLASRRHKE